MRETKITCDVCGSSVMPHEGDNYLHFSNSSQFAHIDDICSDCISDIKAWILKKSGNNVEKYRTFFYKKETPV